MIPLRMLLVGFVVLQGLGIGAALGGDESGTRRDSRVPAKPVKTMVCGPNALYMLLKLCGRPVTYEQVAHELGSDNKITTMVELRDAAARLGLPTRVRRCTLENLDKCVLPFIAYTKTDYGTLADGRIGHYWVVLKVDPDRIEFIDGTCGEIASGQRSRFAAYWTGYLLEPSTGGGPGTRMAFVASGIGYSAALGLIVFISRRQSPTRARILGAGLLFVACWSASGATAVAASEPSEGAHGDPADWRSPANDGATCLYLQLAALGHPIDYASVRQAVSDAGSTVTLVSLREAAQRCGVRMRIVRCRPDELRRMPKPVITYIHGVRTGGGFALLYSMDKKCGLIPGATACIEELKIDKFRRDWSGFVLVPQPPGSWWNSIAGSLVVLAAYCGWRLWIGG
jgi:peptidase C39-like protein